jgi:hypothetical protein
MAEQALHRSVLPRNRRAVMPSTQKLQSVDASSMAISAYACWTGLYLLVFSVSSPLLRCSVVYPFPPQSPLL